MSAYLTFTRDPPGADTMSAYLAFTRNARAPKP